MHRSHILGKKKTFPLYDCCDFFQNAPKRGQRETTSHNNKKKLTSHIHFGGGSGWEFTPYIYFFLKKCPITTTLMYTPVLPLSILKY